MTADKVYAEKFRLMESRMKQLEQQLCSAGISITTGKAKSAGDNNEDGTEDWTPAIDRTTTPGAPANSGASIQTLEKRIKYIEQSMRDQDILDESSLKSDTNSELESAPERVPAIPSLHRVEWTIFKNRWTEGRQQYAIEILVGEARYYHQFKEEDRKGKRWLEDNQDGYSNRLEVPIEHVPSRYNGAGEMPERIRINSKPIVEILAKLDMTGEMHAGIGGSVVVLRPYKTLIYHDKSNRQTYESLKAKWGRLKADTGLKSPVPTVPGKVEREDDTSVFTSRDKMSESMHRPIQPVLFGEQVDAGANASGNTLVFEPKQVMEPDASGSCSPRGPIEHAAAVDHVSAMDATISNHPMPECELVRPFQIIDETNRETSAMPSINEEYHDSTKEDAQEEDPFDLTDCVEALRDFRCLIDFLDQEVRPVLQDLENSTLSKIAFSNLYHIFKPGELVIAPLGSKSLIELGVTYGNEFWGRKPSDRYQEAWCVFGTANGRPNLSKKSTSPTVIDKTNADTRVNSFVIAAYHLDYTGTRFTTLSHQFSIEPFQGEKDISSFDVYPVRFASKAEDKVTQWEVRGKNFLQYMSIQQRFYKGRTLIGHPSGIHPEQDQLPKHTEYIDSQVVIDFNESLNAHPGWTPIATLITLPLSAPRETREDLHVSYWKDRNMRCAATTEFEWVYIDRYADKKSLDDYRLEDEMTREVPPVGFAVEGKLSKRHLVLLPNRVFGYVLRNRKFGKTVHYTKHSHCADSLRALLTVDGLRSIQRYQNGFDDLQLPPDHKQTVKSLVQNHFTSKLADAHGLNATHDADIVRGKGNGVVVLLHGAPGVGKTSTAECVAEAFGKLLFPITCGDLGLVAEEVENELSEKFHLAELWDCVLLLDEADVFLARRTNTDVKRNSLVSVFLRMLEYFAGILFLTTNRVGAFDEAFKSRIHISLYYPPLDWEQSEKIWMMNLRRLSEKKKRRHEILNLDEEEILDYAFNHFNYTAKMEMSWNGRQIKNAVQTATALAEYDAQQKTQKAIADHQKQQRDGDRLDSGEPPNPTEPVLKVSHLKKVAAASYDFDRYIKATKGFTDAESAHLQAERTDHFRVVSHQSRPQKQPYMHPEAVNPLSHMYHTRGPPQPVRQASQVPLSDTGKYYSTHPHAFPGGASQSMGRMATGDSGLASHQGPQLTQQLPPSQSTVPLRAHQPLTRQDTFRNSVDNHSPRMLPSEVTHHQADATMKLHDAPPASTMDCTWESRNPSAAGAFEPRHSPQRQELSQQQLYPPQRQERFALPGGAHYQPSRVNPTEDPNSVFE